MIIKIFYIFFLFSFISRICVAGSLENDMEGFWRKMGGDVNITGYGAYQGQAAGMYTLGNIHARTGIENVSLYNLQMPSYRAGCGGIDVFAGAFSHINSDQMVATMKAIGNNAASFAFKLALDTISPAIGAQIDELTDFMERINSMNINSCEQAAALVGGLWPRHDRASASICASIGMRRGVFSDYAANKHGCNNGGRRAEINNMESQEHESVKIEDINLAWEAIKKSNLFGSNANFDMQLAQIFMTLSGTVIIKAPENEDQGAKIITIAPKIDDKHFISTLLDGGTINIHRCVDEHKCLDIQENILMQHISTNNAFKNKISKMIEDMIIKVTQRRNEPLTEAQKALLNITSIPIYKILNVYAAYSGAGAMIDLPNYSEIIALDIIHEYIYLILDKIDDATTTLQLTNSDNLEKYKQSLFFSRNKITVSEKRNMAKSEATLRMIERTVMIENMLSAYLGKSLNNK